MGVGGLERGEEGMSQRPPMVESMVASIGALKFQTIVDDEVDWGGLEQGGVNGFPVKAGLKDMESQRAVLFPAEQFPIEDRSIR